MLKAVVTQSEFDGLAGEVQSHYVKSEDGESYQLGVVAVNGIELSNNQALKKALQTERTSAEKATKELKSLKESFGDLNPEAAREALAKMEEMANWNPDDKLKEARAQFEKQLTTKYEDEKNKLVKKYTADVEATKKELETASTQLEQVMIDSEIAKAVATEKGVLKLLAPVIKQNVRLIRNDDGTRHVRILEPDGTFRLSSKSGSTDPMSISEFVSEMKADETFARAFEGSGASGSGAGATGNVGSSTNGAFRLSAIDARDPMKYRAAKANAEKAGKQLEIVGD